MGGFFPPSLWCFRLHCLLSFALFDDTLGAYVLRRRQQPLKAGKRRVYSVRSARKISTSCTVGGARVDNSSAFVNDAAYGTQQIHPRASKNPQRQKSGARVYVMLLVQKIAADTVRSNPPPPTDAMEA